MSESGRTSVGILRLAITGWKIGQTKKVGGISVTLRGFHYLEGI